MACRQNRRILGLRVFPSRVATRGPGPGARGGGKNGEGRKGRKGRKGRPGARHLPGSSSGVALLLVITVIAFLMALVVDLQYSSRLQLQMAANSRNRLQARYLARSALNLSLMVLMFDRRLNHLMGMAKKNPMAAKYLGGLTGQRIPLWTYLNGIVDCGFMRTIGSGIFGRAKVEPAKVPTGLPGEQVKLYRFGNFAGSCKWRLSDEEGKISLNRLRHIQDEKAAMAQIRELFAPARYNPLFERRLPDGGFANREEMIHALKDWVDPDQTRGGSHGGSEDSVYQEKGYKSKNDMFYSLQELRLVHGVDDIFFDTFASMFTVYTESKKVNVNTAKWELLKALIKRHAINKGDARLSDYGAVLMKPFKDQLMMWQQQGFGTVDSFIARVNAPSWPVVYGQAAPPRPPEPITVNKKTIIKDIKISSETFKIVAVGMVGATRVTATGVWRYPDSGRPSLRYYREE